MSWLKECYSRLLIDNHITDAKPEFMSRFDPDRYVAMVKLSGVECAMVYACDHNGNCYYPTQVGHQHAGLRGRDGFGAVIAGLRDAGIVPVAYYTVIYHNDAAARLPDVRMRDCNGVEHHGRYHYCCPSHPAAREFFKAQIAEILTYPVAGLFIDMTFWPMVCCCEHCRAAYRSRSGREWPERICWDDPAWVGFQRFREQMMGDFALELTAWVRQMRPDITVTHQFSPMLHGWYLGQSSAIAQASDYVSGDFYGGKLQQRFAVKAFAAYSTQKPFEYMTSRCVSLHDHTSTKSDEELLLHALTTLANGGAYFFIDAINPDGTLEEAFYRRLAALNAQLRPFATRVKQLAPEPCAEVGLYFSMASGVDRALQGLPLTELNKSGSNMASRENSVLDEILGTALLLTQLHIPYRVVTDQTEFDPGLRALIVNAAAYLSVTECERLRRFTAGGGTLIATGRTSLFDLNGNSSGDFALSDLFGVSFSGRETGRWSYLRTADGLLSTSDSAPLVQAHADATVLGTVTLPDFPADDPVHYASIHSNPPGIATDCAGWVEHAYGAGRCVYLYSGLLALRQHSQQEFGRALFRRYLPQLVLESRHLPDSAEVTLLRNTAAPGFFLTVVNYQEELPNIELRDVELLLRLPEGFEPGAIIRVSDGEPALWRREPAGLRLCIPRLQYAEFFELRPASTPDDQAKGTL